MTVLRLVLSMPSGFAAEEVSKDPDIGLHLGEHLPLYRGQVIEHLFISSENFGEGLKRALAYQRLISDAFMPSWWSKMIAAI